jgi:hypothetical protein
VIGNNIAIVVSGPMPGSTPTSVPTVAPIRQYSKLTGETATPNPIHRLLIVSTLRHHGPIGTGNPSRRTNTTQVSTASTIALTTASTSRNR